MEIENATFQDLESFGKERFFTMAIEKLWVFIRGKFYNIIKWIKFCVVLNTAYVVLLSFTICNIKYNLPKRL